jgi:HEAT repeat protein
MACVIRKKQPIEHSTVDPLLRTRWINDLLRLRDKNDPELIQRVRALLALAGRSTTPDLFERELRAFGERGAPALLSILNRSPDSWSFEQRRHAARVLADLAGPREVAALVKLLRDDDGDVRTAAERALIRITGTSLKGAEAWEDWLQKNLESWSPR